MTPLIRNGTNRIDISGPTLSCLFLISQRYLHRLRISAKYCSIVGIWVMLLWYMLGRRDERRAIKGPRESGVDLGLRLFVFSCLCVELLCLLENQLPFLFFLTSSSSGCGIDIGFWSPGKSSKGKGMGNKVTTWSAMANMHTFTGPTEFILKIKCTTLFFSVHLYFCGHITSCLIS